MKWKVVLHEEFKKELFQLSANVQDSIAKEMRMLQEFSPNLGRTHVDTLHGSRYSNMKELRFDAANGTWRVAFAFDPERKAVLLVAGDKGGKSTKLFYKNLIRKADERFSNWVHLKNKK